MIKFLSLCLCLLAIGCATSSHIKSDLQQQVARLERSYAMDEVPVAIYGMGLTYPNYASGVDCYIGFINTSPKTIKYIEFIITVLNRVGDPAVCSIRRDASLIVRETGPIEPGGGAQHRGRQWSNVVYNSTADFVRIDGVAVEYMDGSAVSIGAKAVDSLFTDPRFNDYASEYQQTHLATYHRGTLTLKDISYLRRR